MKFTGRVIKKTFGKGSKSEHVAVVLVTDNDEYVLRIPGGNDFYEPQLIELVGKNITCTGYLSEYVVFVTEWEVID